MLPGRKEGEWKVAEGRRRWPKEREAGRSVKEKKEKIKRGCGKRVVSQKIPSTDNQDSKAKPAAAAEGATNNQTRRKRNGD